MPDPVMDQALRSILLAFVVPSVLFAALAVVVERRAGPRWLPPLWALAVVLVAGFLVLRVRGLTPEATARLGAAGGPRGLLAGGLVAFALPFGLACLAAWRFGRHARRPRGALPQSVAAGLAALLGLPVALAIAFLVQSLRGR